jgi:hypothetical protein
MVLRSHVDAGLRESPVPDAAVNEARGRRWQRVPLFLHLRALKPLT